MTTVFLFCLFLLLENLLLPALLGPKPFLIILTFVFTIFIYSENVKLKFAQAIIFLGINEIFSYSEFGSMILPFTIVALLYFGLNHYLNIKSSLQESSFFTGLFGGAVFLTLLAFLYSYVFLFFQLSNNILEAWQSALVFIKTSFYQTFGWALVLVVIFKYVFKTK